MADARAKTARPTQSEFAEFEPYLRDYGTTAQILRAARSLSDVVEDLSQPADSPEAYGAVIDGTDLLLGFVAVGTEFAGRESSAAWVVEWLKDHGFAPDRLLEQRRAQLSETSMSQPATTAIPSQALTEHILPAAVDLAKRTVDRDRADARHLLWALLDQPLNGPLAEILDAGSVRDAKRYIVARLEKSHEEDEKIEVWRALAEDSEPSRPAETSAPPTETVGTLSDAPALVHALGRQRRKTRLEPALFPLAGRDRERGRAAALARDHRGNAAALVRPDGPGRQGYHALRGRAGAPPLRRHGV